MSMIFQSYALWPHMTVARERRLRPEAAEARPRRRSRKKLDAILATTRLDGVRRPLSRRAFRRPAAARGARARARRRARNAAARRAAVQPRRQPARGDALRGAPPARRISLHDGLRDARPGRGDDHRRPHRGDERAARSSRPARPRKSTTGRARNSSPASSASSNIVKGSNARRAATSSSPACRCAAAAPALAAGGETARLDPPARHPALGREAGGSRENVLAGTVVRQVFLGGSRDYMVEVADGTQLRVVAPAAQNIAAGRSGLAASAARALPGAERMKRSENA